MNRIRLTLLAGALAVASPAVADMPKAQAIYKQGNEAFRAGDPKTAIEFYHQVLKEEPSYADYMDKPLGQAYLKLGDEGKALYYLNRALARAPEDKLLASQVEWLEKRDVLPDSSAAGTTLQGTRLRKNQIYFNTGDMARSSFSLGYERALGSHNSWLIDGVYGAREASGSSYQTYGGGAGWHFWFKALDGAFFGPKATFQSGFAEDTTTVYNYTLGQYVTQKVRLDLARYSVGMEAGYQWTYDSGFSWAFGYGIFHHQFVNGDPSGSYYYNAYYGSSRTVQSNLLLTLGFVF